MARMKYGHDGGHLYLLGPNIDPPWRDEAEKEKYPSLAKHRWRIETARIRYGNVMFGFYGKPFKARWGGNTSFRGEKREYTHRSATLLLGKWSVEIQHATYEDSTYRADVTTKKGT